LILGVAVRYFQYFKYIAGFSVYFPFYRLERLRCPVAVSSACRLLGQNLVIAIYLIIFEEPQMWASMGNTGVGQMGQTVPCGIRNLVTAAP